MEVEQAIETPKPKRKYTRKQQAAPKPRQVNELAGLTATECCSGCSPDGCVISGRYYCAHPRKGGLQTIDMGNMDVIHRFNRAKKMAAGK